MGERRALDPPGDTRPMRSSVSALVAVFVATAPLYGGTVPAESLYPSKVTPESKELREAIERALGH
jgi:hypothetical protein